MSDLNSATSIQTPVEQYCNDKQILANTGEPDQTPNFAASDLGLQNLPLLHSFKHINKL